MKRNLIVLDLILLLVALWLVFSLKEKWVEFGAEHSLSRLNPQLRKGSQTPVPRSGQTRVSDYTPIVEGHLFTPDRNNVVAPEPSEETKKITAPKPVLTGILAFGDQEYALMMSSEPKENQNYKRLKVGDSLSGYTLVKILEQKVQMDVDGTKVEIPISEPTHLVARDVGAAGAGGTAAPGGAKVATVGSGPPSGTGPAASSAASARRDDLPAGTIVNGKKKVVHSSPFGDIVVWTDAK